MGISRRSPSAIAAAFVLFSAVLCAFHIPAWAQEARSAAPNDRDAVVVTATRVPTRVNQLTTDVTVIDRQEIEQSGPTLREVLRQVPGLEITQSGGPGTIMSLFIRGTNSDHVLVIVDGVRLGSATAGTTALENIPLDAIERIEVLRGPASSLYGSSAIGGVIQIFTRSGAGNPGWNASAGIGSYGTSKFSLGRGGEDDGLRYAFQAGFTDSDGLTAIRDGRSTSFNPDADAYRNASFTGNIAKLFGPGREIGLRTLYSDGVAHFDSLPVTNDFRTYSTLTDSSVYGQMPLGERWNTRLTLGNSTDDSTSYTHASSKSVIRTRQNQVIWQNDVKLPLGTAMLLAEKLEQRVEGSTAYAMTRRDIRTLAAAWQANTGAHSFQASARRDQYDQYGTKNTGYGGYGFGFAPQWRASVGVGTAFKAPSFNQLYFPGFGNPNLLPESSRNREAGLHYDGAPVQLSVVHYVNRIRNLIINAGSPLLPRNVGEARITGTTVTASTRVDETDLSANVSYQDPRDATNGLMLSRRARKFGTFAVTRPAFDGRLGLEVYASGRRFNDTPNLVNMGGYTLLNASYERPLDRGWTLFARADNLGDRRYESIQFFNVPGRSLFIGVRYNEK